MLRARGTPCKLGSLRAARAPALARARPDARGAPGRARGRPARARLRELRDGQHAVLAAVSVDRRAPVQRVRAVPQAAQPAPRVPQAARRTHARVRGAAPADQSERVPAGHARTFRIWRVRLLMRPGIGAPASFIVNQKAQRFANEALPYNDFPKAFGAYDPDDVDFPNRGPGFLIFDQTVRADQRILSMMPDGPDPEWIVKADTIVELAGQLGLEADALEATVERYNRHAADGVDPDFHRHERGLMGPGTVQPLLEPPFYAVEIHAGTLGTNGGPQIDRNGQVRRAGGGVVPGLYAAGNTAANVFGWAYPSGGGTLGNGMVFGYLAGRHVAARVSRDL